MGADCSKEERLDSDTAHGSGRLAGTASRFMRGILPHASARLRGLVLESGPGMNLHEYQSKQLFARYGIPVPTGTKVRVVAGGIRRDTRPVLMPAFAGHIHTPGAGVRTTC